MFSLCPYSSFLFLLSFFGKTKLFFCICISLFTLSFSIFFIEFIISQYPDIHPLITPSNRNIKVNGKWKFSSNLIPINVQSKTGVTMVKPTCEINDKYLKASTIFHLLLYSKTVKTFNIFQYLNLLFFDFIIIPIYSCLVYIVFFLSILNSKIECKNIYFSFQKNVNQYYANRKYLL